MIIKKVKAKINLDSRREKTILVSVNGHKSSAPFGASRGKYEAKPYKTTLERDVQFINNFNKKNKLEKLPGIEEFEDLKKIERLIKRKIGANTLFAFESSILKALAGAQKKELWHLLNPKAKKIPLLLSNIIGGGAHSHNKNKPDFQEFLVIGNKKINKFVYKRVGKIFGFREKNDEGAWQTDLENEAIFSIFKTLELKAGVDMAASQLYKNSKYYYKNPRIVKNKAKQIEYVLYLINSYNLKYVEDPLEEQDFKGFAEILEKVGKKCLIVGDDLTTTNLKRANKAIKDKSINAIIIKPNQIGSLIEAKKVVDLCKKNNIKTIMSHRSGETLDNVIADLSVAWQCDMLKISINGKERLTKIKRLEKIRKGL